MKQDKHDIITHEPYFDAHRAFGGSYTYADKAAALGSLVTRRELDRSITIQRHSAHHCPLL